MPILRHLASWMFLIAGAVASEETPPLQLTERFGVAHPEQIVEFILPEPLETGTWSVREADGTVRPAQVLTGGKRAALQTDLPAGASRSWTLAQGLSAQPVKNAVFIRTNTASLELGNARHSLYGWEAALHFSVMRRWPGMDNDDDPKLDTESPRIRWTLLWDNLVHEAPVGLRLGRGMENTVVDGQVTVNARRPLWDSGRGTQTRSLDARHGPAVDARKETKE